MVFWPGGTEGEERWVDGGGSGGEEGRGLRSAEYELVLTSRERRGVE